MNVISKLKDILGREVGEAALSPGHRVWKWCGNGLELEWCTE